MGFQSRSASSNLPVVKPPRRGGKYALFGEKKSCGGHDDSEREVMTPLNLIIGGLLVLQLQRACTRSAETAELNRPNSCVFLTMNITAQTLSAVSTNPWLGHNFTIHHYENSIHPSEDRPGVLTQGYKVIFAAVFGDLTWRSPNAVPPISRKRHGAVCLYPRCARPSPPHPSK